MTDNKVCETCRFFDEHPAVGGIRAGQCKRRAPTLIGQTTDDAQVARLWMGVADWCGEHEEAGADPNAKLRDDFAAAALTGLLAAPCEKFSSLIGLQQHGFDDLMAVNSYALADAMLRARESSS